MGLSGRWPDEEPGRGFDAGLRVRSAFDVMRAAALVVGCVLGLALTALFIAFLAS